MPRIGKQFESGTAILCGDSSHTTTYSLDRVTHKCSMGLHTLAIELCYLILMQVLIVRVHSPAGRQSELRAYMVLLHGPGWL